MRRFVYNSRHQQTKVETEDGRVQKNLYDAEGLRFELTENGKRACFVYYDSELLYEEEKKYENGNTAKGYDRGYEGAR